MALAIEVRTAAMPALLAVILPLAASAAAVAVVLALLTRPPATLNTTKPRLPKNLCARVPAAASVTKTAANFSTCRIEIGDERESGDILVPSRSRCSQTSESAASVIATKGISAVPTAAGAKIARITRLRRNIATLVIIIAATTSEDELSTSLKRPQSSVAAAVLLTSPPRKAA